MKTGSIARIIKRQDVFHVANIPPGAIVTLRTQEGTARWLVVRSTLESVDLICVNEQAPHNWRECTAGDLFECLTITPDDLGITVIVEDVQQ